MTQKQTEPDRRGRERFFVSGLRGQEGFTLLEVVIALGILALIGVGFAAALSAGTRATGTLDEQVQAEALARSWLEQIKNPATAVSTATPCVYPTPTVSVQDYSVAVQCQTVGGSSPQVLQQVTVAVSRTSTGKPLLSLTTYKRQ